MSTSPSQAKNDYKVKLKWLIFFRLIFSSLLLGSTIILQFGETSSSFVPSLLVLYGIIITIFILTVIYALVLSRIKHDLVFAFFQIAVDTFFVSVIILVTGSFFSVFSFLYLVVKEGKKAMWMRFHVYDT